MNGSSENGDGVDTIPGATAKSYTFVYYCSGEAHASQLCPVAPGDGTGRGRTDMTELPYPRNRAWLVSEMLMAAMDASVCSGHLTPVLPCRVRLTPSVPEHTSADTRHGSSL